MTGEVARRLSEIPRAVVVESGGFMLHRPVESDLLVTATDEGWLVSGRAAERAVAFNDLTIPIAADLAAARLRRAGVEDALVSAGAKPGDEVTIGDIVFEFQPEGEE